MREESTRLGAKTPACSAGACESDDPEPSAATAGCAQRGQQIRTGVTTRHLPVQSAGVDRVRQAVLKIESSRREIG